MPEIEGIKLDSDVKENKTKDLEDKKKVLKNKISSWFSNKNNLYFALILLFAFIIRIYFFYVTKNQVLWWDEAEYMLKAKSIALGTPDTGWWSGRPILSAYLLAVPIFLGLGAAGIKFIMIIFSMLVLVLTYLVGKEFFDEKVALIGTFIFSVLYLNLFYTSRILINMPELFIGLLIFYLFYKSYSSNKNYLYLIIPLTAIGFFIRFTVAIYAFIAFVFILLSRDFTPLKEKKFKYLFSGLVVLGIIGFIASIVILKKNLLGGFWEAFSGGIILRHAAESRFSVFSSYLKNIWGSMGITFMILFFIGLFSYFYHFVIMIDKNIKRPVSKESKQKLFVLVWIIITLIIYGIILNHFEDRYLMMIFPIISLLSASGAFFLYQTIRKRSKMFATVAVIAIILLGSYLILNQANGIIRNGAIGFKDLDKAGEWIKQNTNPGDVIISSALPQMTYYTERETYPVSSNESEFAKLIEEKKPKMLLVTVMQRSPEWVYPWPENNKDKVVPVKVYYLDAEQKQPATVIYSFK